MSIELLTDLSRFPAVPMPHQVMVSVLKRYDRPNDKIYRLIREGKLVSVRKGLYILGPGLNSGNVPAPFLLANHILGPSYVSVEAALSYHGLIPERVYEISSMTVKASRAFDTPNGYFTYKRLSLPYYSYGIKSVRLGDNQYAMIASPEKAIFDKVVTTSKLTLRSKRAATGFLLENMRMDEDMLKQLDLRAMGSWIDRTMKAESLAMIVNALRDI